MTELKFWVTPFDPGIRVLKSDKYLQFAETAQVDYLLRAGKFFTIVSGGASFVNVAQFVRFTKPVPVLGRIRVETELIYSDDKCDYFSHTMYSRDGPTAEVLIKMKFTKGRIAVAPFLLLPVLFAAIAEKVQGLEPALAAQ